MTKYCRVDLSKTNYNTHPNAILLTINQRKQLFNTISEIYIKYCRYKKFKSVVPLFYSEFIAENCDVFGYFYDKDLVAWSLLIRHDHTNVEGIQFAWEYTEPDLKLGFESLMHECAYYKNLGYRYLYLGEASKYKSLLSGYEILGEI